MRRSSTGMKLQLLSKEWIHLIGHYSSVTYVLNCVFSEGCSKMNTLSSLPTSNCVLLQSFSFSIFENFITVFIMTRGTL